MFRSVKTLKGLRERSTEVTVSETMRAPHLTLCSRILSMSSPPMMLTKPGKFSTSVVVVSCGARKSNKS